MRKEVIIDCTVIALVEGIIIYTLTGSIMTGALCVCSTVLGMVLGTIILKYLPTHASSVSVAISMVACAVCALSYQELNTSDIIIACLCGSLMVETLGGHFVLCEN